MGWKQESLVVGQIRSSRKWISKISEGLGGPGLSWLIREALSATPASGWGGRECCYKLAGMSQIEPLPAQPPCVLTRCCVLVCWAAAVWQLLEEGFHHTRLLLISPHLSCQGSDWKIILNAMGPAKKAIVFGRVSSKVRCFSKHWMKQDCLYISFKWECFSWTFSFYFWRNEKGSLKIQPEVNMLKHSQVHDV